MGEQLRPTARETAKAVFDELVERKRRRDAATAAGDTEPSAAASAASFAVRTIPLDQRDRLIAMLAFVSDMSIPDMQAASLGRITDLVEAAARAEGRSGPAVRMMNDGESANLVRERAGKAWRDASDVDRGPIVDALQSLFGEHITAAEKAELAEASGAAEADDPVDDIAAEYDMVPPVVTIRLQFPFSVDGHKIRQVSLRPPRFCDVQKVAAGKLERTAMIAEMAGLKVDAINALRWPDAERVVGTAMDMAPEHIGG